MTHALWARLAIALATLCVASGCAPLVIESKPDTFAVPPSAASMLRGQQSIALINTYKGQTQVKIFGGAPGWVADLKQFTDTAITLLGREMTRVGFTVAPATKSVTLRVHDVQAAPGGFIIRSALVLEAAYGDGTKSLISAQNNSPSDAWRAIDGAIMRAVSQLLVDERFVAYVNESGVSAGSNASVPQSVTGPSTPATPANLKQLEGLLPPAGPGKKP